MATYKEQLEYVATLRLKEGVPYRGNCIFCGGRNTFGAVKRNGELLFGCFKASCDVRGRQEGDRTKDGLGYWQKGEQPSGIVLAPVPSVLTSIENQDDALTYLKSVNSLEAYEAGLITVRYAPTEDRVMFGVGKEGFIGRGRQGVKPKWKKYGDCSSLFSCGSGKIGVLVEDAPSACAVGVIPEYTGLSLLGTSLTGTHKTQLRGFERVLVCLDPDARAKGLKLVQSLRGTANASIRLIPDDLKELGKDDIVCSLQDR